LLTCCPLKHNPSMKIDPERLRGRIHLLQAFLDGKNIQKRYTDWAQNEWSECTLAELVFYSNEWTFRIKPEARDVWIHDSWMVQNQPNFVKLKKPGDSSHYIHFKEVL